MKIMRKSTLEKLENKKDNLIAQNRGITFTALFFSLLALISVIISKC